MVAREFNTTDKKREALRSYANTIDISSRVKDRKAEQIASKISGKSSVRDNKESKNIIEHFVNNVDVGLLMTIFTMFGTIITTGITLYRSLRKFKDGSAYNGNNDNKSGGSDRLNRRSMLFESENLDVFEPITSFEPLTYSQIVNLYESEQFQELPEDQQLMLVNEISEKSISEVIDNDNAMFKFENGAEMESLASNKLSNLNFSLRYHANKSKSVDEFLENVDNYLSIANQSMTDFDRESLTKHYNRYK